MVGAWPNVGGAWEACSLGGALWWWLPPLPEPWLVVQPPQHPLQQHLPYHLHLGLRAWVGTCLALCVVVGRRPVQQLPSREPSREVLG